MPDNEYLQGIYNDLKDNYNIGTIDEFSSAMQDEDNLKGLYNDLKKTRNLGDYDTFKSDMGFGETQIQPTEQQQAEETVQSQPQEAKIEQPKEKPQPVETKQEVKPKEKTKEELEAEARLEREKQAEEYQKEHPWEDFVNQPGNNVFKPVWEQEAQLSASMPNKFLQEQEKLDAINSPLATEREMKHRLDYAVDQFSDILDEFFEGTSGEILNLGNEARNAEIERVSEKKEKEPAWLRFIRGLGRTDKTATEMAEQTKVVRAGNEAKQEAVKQGMESLRKSVADLTGVSYNSLVEPVKQEAKKDNSWFGKFLEWSTNRNTSDTDVDGGEGGWLASLLSIPEEEKEDEKANEAYDIVKNNASEIGQKYNALLSEMSNQLGLSPQRLNEELAKQAYSLADYELNMAQIAENTPSGRAEYYLERSFENSVLGKMISAAVLTPEQYDMRTMATQLYGQDLTAWDRAGMSALTFLWDSALLAGYGRFGSSLGNAVFSRAATVLIGRGMPRTVVMRYVNFLCANNYWARAGKNVLTGAISGSQMLGLYNLTSELASQNASGKYDWEAAKQSYLDGVGTGATLSVVGAPVGAWAQTLTGATKVLGKGASFVAEGMAFSASSQLQKMVKGEELDPWLDSFVDSYIQLAFLKGLSTGGLKTMYKAFTDPKALLQAEDLGGYHLSQEQVKQLRDYGGGLFKLLTSMTPSEYSEYYNRNVDTKGLTRNKEVNIPQEKRTPKQQDLAERTQRLRAEMKRFLENENIDWEAKQAVVNTLGGWLDPVNRTTPTTVRQERDLDTGKTIISVLDTNGREISKTEIDSDGDIQGEYDKARQQVVNAQLDAVGIGNPVAWDEVKRAMGNTISSDNFMEAQLNAAEVARMRENYAALKTNGASRAELQEAYDTYLESKLSLDETSARALDLYFQMVAGDALPPTADNIESNGGGGGGNLPVAPIVPVRADDNPRGVGDLAELNTTLKERQGEELLAQATQDPVNALQKAREMVEDENADYTEQDYEDLKNYINVARTQTLNSLYDEGYNSGNAAEQTQIYRESIEAYEDMVNEWTDEELTRLEENPQEELSKILNAALDPDSPVTIDDYLKAENYAKLAHKQLGVKESFSGTPKRTKEGKSAQELLDDWTLSQIAQATPVDALKMANEWLNDSKNSFDIYDFQAVQQYILERELAKIPKARAEGRSITDPVDKEQAVSLYAKQYASIWRNRTNRGDLTRINDDPEAFLEEYLNRSLDGERPITQEDFEEVSKYIHALEVIRGICERELQDAQQDDLEYVRSLELKDDKGEPLGRIINVTMKDGEEVNVVSGDIVLADDGHTIDGSRSSETVVVLYEDGTMAMVSPTQDILRVDDIFSEEEYLQNVSSTQKVMEAQQRRIRDALTREMLPQMKQEAQDAYDDVITDIIKRTGDEDSARDFIDTISEEGGLDRLIAYANDEEQPDFTQEDVELAQRFLQAQAELERVRAIEEDLAKEPQEEIPADTEQTAGEEGTPTTTATETTNATEGEETPTTESGETSPATESEQTQEGETANVPDVRKTLSDNGLDEETINSLVTNPKQALADLKGKVSDEVYNIAKGYAELQWVSNLSADKEPDWNSAPTAGAAFDGIVALAGGDTNLALKEAKAVLNDKRKIAEKAKKEAEKPGKGKTLVERLADSKKRQDEADKAQEEVRLWSNIVDIPRARQAQKEREALEARRKKAEEEAKKAEEEAKRIQAEKEALKGVPDATIPKADTYEAAQNRGFWNVGGKKVDRQGVLNAPQGIETHVAFAKLDDGSGIATGHVALVSADDLQPSHKRGVKNWKLFTDTQPKRARNTPESIGAIRETAQKLDPAKLMGVTNAYQDSMPSVNTRGEVIQGHGRTDAIQQAYEDFPERAAQYKQYLIDHAKEFGIDPEEVAKMEKPVFVNMMDVSDAEAKRWAGFKQGQLESGGYVSLDGKTIAKQMSNKEFSRFISKLMENAGDEDSFAQLLDKNGAKVIMELTKSGLISNAQNRSAIDANGHLVPAASNDIANLLLGRMFGDDVNTATLFQSSSFPKKAQRAILSSIYKDFATKDPDQTIAPEISNAIKAFSELTADESFMSAKDFPTAKKLAESFIGQAQFDADGNITYPLKDYSNFAVTLAALFKGGTQKDIQATLTDIISLVQGNKQSGLFDENGGDATPEPPKSLREAVKQVLDIDYNENEQQKRVKKDEGQEGNSTVDVDNASSAAGEQTNEASSNGGESTQTGAEPADNTGGTTSVSGQGQQGEVKNPYNLPTDEEYDKRIAEAKENGGSAELVITLKKQAQSIRNNRTWQTLGFGRMRLEQLLKDSKIKPTEQDLADIEKINKAQEEYEKGIPERSARRSEIKKLLNGLDRQIENEKDPVKKAELQKQRDDLTKERRELEEIDGMVSGNLSETNTSENTPSTQVTEQPSSMQEAIQEAEKKVNTEPTEAQAKAGNYAKGHFTIDGHDVTIENPKGSIRRGKDADGKTWETKMNNTYGYIKGTKGVDGDHIDVFLSDNPDEGDIYVVDQVNPKTGEFDEHKVMYGFNSEQEARDAYLSNYEKDWKGLGNITKVSREEFKKWIDSSTRKTKPFAEYKSVKPSETLDETPAEAKPLLNENDNIPTAMNKAAGKTLVKVNKSDRGDYLYVFTDIGYKGGKAKTVNYTHFGLGEGAQIEKTRENVGVFVAKLKANGYREATPEELKQIESFVKETREKEAKEILNNHPKTTEKSQTRFRETNEGVRFRTDEKENGEKPSLVALHNITQDKFKQAMKLGGFANPSIGVVDKKHGLNSFGDITLVLPSDKLYEFPTYTGDVWTVMFPHTEKRPELGEKNEELFKRLAPDNYAFRWFLDQESLRRLRTQKQPIVESSVGMCYMFLKDKGFPVKEIKKSDDGETVVRPILNDAAKQVLDDENLSKEYVAWLDNINKNILTNEYIKGTLDKPTLENISSYMNDIEHRYYDVKTKLFKELWSPEDIRKESTRLENPGKDIGEGGSGSDVAFDVFDKIGAKYGEEGDSNIEKGRKGATRVTQIYDENDYSGYTPEERKSHFVEDLMELDDNVTKGEAELTYDYIQYTRNFRGTNYFEAKADRPLKLNEFAGAIIPEDTSKEIVDYLEKAGIPIYKYKRGETFRDRADYLRALDEATQKEGTLFRIDENGQNEVASTPEEISEHIDNLQKRFKNKVTQINSLDEVTDERARKKIEQDQKNGTKKTKGWYDPNTGEVVLYMPNVTSVEDAERTIIHETKGHKGLRALLGDNFNKSMDKIYNLLPKEVREKIKVTADEKYGGDLIEATEEHLSETAEKDEMPSWWEKVCATVKDYIRKAGFDLEMTDSDVKYLLWKAEQKLAEGNALDKAEDIAMRNRVERENIKLRSENPFANASAEELDNAYFDAYDKGDRARMREIIDEVARRRGYSNVEDWRYYHSAPMREEETKDDEGSLYTWTLKDEADDNPHRANHISDSYYASVDINGSRDESMSAIQSALDKIKQGKDPTVTIYRAVPKSVKESKMRNGDWVTFSRAYADSHGESNIGIGDYRIIKEKVPASQVYWDGNDINEWGFDDGKDYKYKNTENNRKLNNTITFDDEGNIIPPSKRFDSTKESVRFREDDNENNGNIIVNENGGDVVLPEDSDIDFGDDYDSAEEAVKNSTKISPTKSARETRQFLMNEAERNVEALQKTLSAIIDEGNGSKQILRLQRDYDRETLKSFVDEAKEMLTDGTLDTATKADLKNLISTIEGSIGANVKEQRFAGKTLKVPKSPDANLEKSAKRLARIMQTNQFRKAKNILDNIIGMKGTKIGDDRIVRQKDLDVDGQNLMKTIRQNKDLDEKTLEQKITETENMLDSSDDANRKAAEIALQGLIYARQYRDMVTEQIQATRDVVEALNTAKKEKRPKSYIQALEDKLFDIKQNTIDKMNNLSCSLVKELGASAERAKEFANEQRRIVEEAHHNANSDMEGRPYTEQNDETKVQKVLNHPFVQFFLEPLGTFNTMLKLFGNKAVDGRGYLWNHYIPKGIKASVGEANDRYEGQDILGKKAAEVFGVDGMRWSDLFKMTRKTLPIKVKYEDGGEKEPHDITIGTGMYVYMVNKMIDGKVKLRGMGIEEEDVERIKEALDPKLVELADWVQDEFLVNWRNKYNPTYERIYGASMDAIENYVPLRINERSRYKKKDINDQNNGIVLPSTVTGAIMKRTFNTTPIDMRTDAVDVILSHVYEMAHWGNFSEYAHDINVLLSYKRFENQVHNMTSVYGGGDILWKKFERVAAMAGGVDYGRSGLRSQDEWVRKAASGVTRAQIAFRLNTAFKQVLSAPAFWSQASIPNLVKAQLHPFKNFKWAMENLPLFEKRWKSRQIGDTRLSDADSTGSLITSKFVDKMSKIGMLPNVFVDAMTVATGAKAVYETSYARYKEEGYEDEIAKKKALLDASVSYNESQQSSENMFVAPSQVDKTLFSTALTAFRNAPYAYGRLVWESFENARRRKFSKGYKENSIAFMQKQALREIGIDPNKAEDTQKDQAHYIAERRYKRQEMKDAVNLVTFGYIVPALWNMGSHLPYFILGQDDDKKLDLLKHDLIKGMWGAIEGLATGNIMSDVVDAVVNGGNLNSLTYYNLPLISEIDHIKDLLNTDVSQAVNAIVNLLFEAGVGVNPRIMEDTALAIYDACKQDTFTMHEAVMIIGKIMQMPQNQLDELYFDKIGMSGKEAGKKAPAEIAERYAINKFKREHFLTEWAMSDKEKEKQMEKYIKRADAKIKERCNGLGVREINKKYDEYQAIHDKIQEEVNSITKLAKKEPQKAKAQADNLMKTKDWVIYQAFKKYDSKYVDKIVKEWINSDKVEKADKFQDAFITNKGKLVNSIDSVLNTSNK